MKVAFITGINWQDWAYLSNFLLSKWYKVIWLLRSPSSNIDNLRYFDIQDKISFIYGDLSDKSIIESTIIRYAPDEIYNLWGLTSPGESWNAIDEYVDVNVHSITNILEVIRNYSPKTKLFQASTSEMFGSSHKKWLQTEDVPFHPTNPYAVTKLFGYWMANIFKEAYHLHISNWILFNHESPLRNLKFVTRKISNWVAQIKLWLSDHIVLGNLDAKRDWWFAWDYVEAMWLILQQKTPDNYILSTGETHTIREFLDIAFKCIGIHDRTPYVQIDSKFNRPIDLPSLYWKNDKAKEILWWNPNVKFEQLVEMMVNEDIRRLS